MRRNRSLPFALLLIGIGVVLLLQQTDVIPEDVDVGPIVLIGIGVLLFGERVIGGGSGGSGFVVPLVIVALGVGLLLQDTGTFKGDDVMLPLVAIAIGAGLMLGALPSRRSSRPERAEVELAGAGRARIEIDHGAGSLRIRSHLGGDDLLEGTFAGGVDVRQRRDGDLLDVTLRADPWHGGFRWPRRGGLDWSVTLARRVPLELTLKTGASRTEADLSDLQVETLRIETGASGTYVTIPSTGRPQVWVHAGAAEIKLTVPARMAARIETRGGLSNVRIDANRFPADGGVYRSPGFDEAIDRADIQIETGAASVEVG